jgi:hypothetical protein
MLTKEEIEQKYQELCVTESDINQHLPTLRMYADQCDTITEMGVRGCVSLFAFLSSNATKVTAIDILDVWVPEVEKLTFICADDLQIEIEPTDMLFIDTAHNYKQLSQELSLHAGKVNKFLAFHDTTIFGIHGDNGGKGLLFAIEDFLQFNRDWVMDFQTPVNNGLTVLKKI